MTLQKFGLTLLLIFLSTPAAAQVGMAARLKMPDMMNWQWINGATTTQQGGSYNATAGSFAAGNHPGARSYATTWADTSGNLWLFGGQGFDINGNEGFLNDLWEYSVSLKEWAWWNGASTNSGAAVYGTKGTAAAANTPQAMGQAAGWVDTSGNFWLHGGLINGGASIYANTWEYSTTTHQWTYQYGPGSSAQVSETAGTSGTFGASYTPGNIAGQMTWVNTATGYLFMYGGYYGDSNVYGESSDIWAFNTATKQWAWYSGPLTAGPTPVMGTSGTFSSTYHPGGRDSGCLWVNSATGYIYVFGGESTDTNAKNGPMNDLWEYNPTTLQWAWISGSMTYNSTGNYGAIRVANSGYIPGSREFQNCFTGINNEFYMFGGQGYDSAGNFGDLNDLWLYIPSANTWTWIKGQLTNGGAATYGTQNLPALNNTPDNRFSASTWFTTNTGLYPWPASGGTRFYLFGGDDNTGTPYSDLWEFIPR
jgi:N-acetylneuraminic acid mutarotase